MTNARRLRVGSAVLAIGGLVAGLWIGGAPQAGAEQRPAAAVTGDRVTTGGRRGQVSVEPGPGRGGITFGITTGDGRVTVTPSDTIQRLAAGTLDPRLFDVTGLIEAGYDRGDRLPLIVAGTPGATAAVTRQGMTALSGLERPRELPAVRGVAVHQPHGTAAEAWRALTTGGPAGGFRAGVGKVWLDGVRRPTLDVSVPQVGAPAAWDRGLTGTGTTVAVLDSGIDGNHPDLTGQVVARQNFTDGVEPDADLVGHGTHVASIVAGTGAASGGRYRGVAPGAKLLDGKVCVNGGCAESWIIAGMTWATVEQHAKVVNLSLGGSDDPAVLDPVEQAVQALSDQTGALFVVSAGNADGPAPGVSSPGSAAAALTVGAVDSADRLAPFSLRGPTGDGRLKPDITAPGVDITAARGGDATAVPGNPGERYTTLSGTSMAAPHVAGGAAILAQQHPTWTGQQLKSALMASARFLPGGSGQGAGRLDLARAVDQRVTTVPASLSFGIQRWPHGDDQVKTQTVQYQNQGPVPLELALRLDTVNPDGSPTAAGMFTVSPASVLVPAGGTATATVTADTRVAGADGYLNGRLVATAGGIESSVPLAVEKEVESYDLTVSHLDRDGTPTQDAILNVAKRDGGFSIQNAGMAATTTYRVPRGHYTVTTMVSTGPVPGKGEPDERTWSLLARPDLDVDRATTVVLDARLARPVAITVPRPDARQVYATISAYGERSGSTLIGGSFDRLYAGRIGPDTTTEGFTSVVSGQWARGDGADSPYFYSLYYPTPAHMISDYRRTVADAELAQVRADFAATRPGSTGWREVWTGSGQLESGNFGPPLPFRLPFTRTEFYNTDPGIESLRHFSEQFASGETTHVQELTYTAFQRGRPYHEQWNRGVFGVSAATLHDNADPRLDIYPGAFRSGDTIHPWLSSYADGAGRVDTAVGDEGITLWRGDTAVAGSASQGFAVPAADAPYRLVLKADRGAPFALSTTVETVWTFRSASVDPATAQHLPLWSIRFAPALDAFNTAPANRVVDLPVILTAQPDSGTGRIVERTVEASFDDGATWSRLRLAGDTAAVRHPGGSGFVSLRATAKDSKGNAVTTTVIRAYRYGPVR